MKEDFFEYLMVSYDRLAAILLRNFLLFSNLFIISKKYVLFDIIHYKI